MKIQIKDIIISERQRKDLGDIPEMADSLSRLGQIHNIGVNENLQLIWGMRRLSAAKLLGWTDIEAVVKPGLSVENEQELELEEDIKRKERTWQEKCLAIAKLFRIKGRAKRAIGEEWTIGMMAAFTGKSTATLSTYMNTMEQALSVEPRDTALWEAPNFSAAMMILRDRAEKDTAVEMERRQAVNRAYAKSVETMVVTATLVVPQGEGKPILSPVQNLKPTLKIGMTHIPLRDRAMLYNQAFEHLWKARLTCHINPKEPSEQFLSGFWFIGGGGGNISDLYGSYQVDYLNRIETLFPDAVKVVHLFVGSLPPSPKYDRVGLSQGDTKPDIECDAHYLSSHLPYKADLIFADPPYSHEDAEHYADSMVNRERVLEECALCLAPGGFIVWIDTALPIFKNEQIRLVGAIGYIRSTGNRFRLVSIFRKP